MPRFVAVFSTMFEGVIGSREVCGIKNSPDDVNICKSLPDLTAFIELRLSLDIVANKASSSRPSSALKLKKSDTFDPNKVLGKDLLPPKKSRPS